MPLPARRSLKKLEGTSKAARRGRHRMNPKYHMRVGNKAHTAQTVMQFLMG